MQAPTSTPTLAPTPTSTTQAVSERANDAGKNSAAGIRGSGGLRSGLNDGSRIVHEGWPWKLKSRESDMLSEAIDATRGGSAVKLKTSTKDGFAHIGNWNTRHMRLVLQADGTLHIEWESEANDMQMKGFLIRSSDHEVFELPLKVSMTILMYL
jgi:hypothetical protein